ncbi:phosphoesterase [Ktedonobacter sp. SOSP1-52]|uniref:metallophosphoesterase family protein n=1 Tax=Ktedonobacter sp. SOSP1-52 TaxID=2778366 RepID=UPI00191508DD|nr:metallophosphoesterase family protein [Ktedonobacter sp. SOSP1-52]GHO66130.1 phosphoesterase [Ktedonobacter sp. SOSP1-52]
MIHRIGVISDTHMPPHKKIPAAVWTLFAGVEQIIHAGDLSCLSVIDELETLAPVVAVQGNVERDDVVMELPIKREILVSFCRIGIVHILGERKYYARNAQREFPQARVVVFGHSHIPYNEEHEGLLLFNPGSANERRSQPKRSIGMLSIDDEAMSVRGEILWLEEEP